MDPVALQYETYPYPARDPADEAKRLIIGSPSDPAEIDHYLFGGARDWSAPFRALVAGGGSGDAAIMMGQLLSDAGVSAEIVYLDQSAAAREIAEARAAARGLTTIRFETGDLLEAGAFGPFDYIDCCGVLHHLPEPQAGFDALADVLVEGGGMGGMVYAPFGRTGVYPLQEALATLTEGMGPAEKLSAAKAALARLPATNWFMRNELLGDHRDSDAGLYDLLLHARDRPYRADELIAAVEAAGLSFVSFVEPARYAPETWLGDAASSAAALSPAARAALAERLAGGIKTHVFYASKRGKGLAKPGPALRPRLRGGVAPGALATHVAGGKAFSVTRDGVKHRISVPREAAPLIRLCDGRRDLAAIAAAAKLDWFALAPRWRPVHDALGGFGMLLYSSRFS